MIYTAKVEPGASVVVFGLGGIGLNVVQGARAWRAPTRLSASTSTPPEEALPRPANSGMTHFVDPKARPGDLVAYLVETHGRWRADDTTASSASAMSRSCAKHSSAVTRGWGVSVIIGVAGVRPGERSRPAPSSSLTGQRLEGGTAFGGAREAARTSPGSSTGHMERKIDIDSLITHKLSLERINEAFDLMHEGKSIRTVVEFA